jgi:hypothetical protein
MRGALSAFDAENVASRWKRSSSPRPARWSVRTMRERPRGPLEQARSGRGKRKRSLARVTPVRRPLSVVRSRHAPNHRSLARTRARAGASRPPFRAEQGSRRRGRDARAVRKAGARRGARNARASGPIRASRPAVDMPAIWAERKPASPFTPTPPATSGRTRGGRCSATTRWRRSRRGRRGRPRV